MKRIVNRKVSVGDLVIQKRPWRAKDTGKFPYVGVVYDVRVVNTYETAFILWSPENPPDYKPEYGLSRLSIHNMHSTYDVVNK